MMEIKTIQMLKNNKIKVTAVHENNGVTSEDARTSGDEPSEAFTAALNSLKKHACKIMEFVKGDVAKTLVTQVSFKRTCKEQARGAHFYISRVLGTSDAPVSIKLPLKFIDKPSDDTSDMMLYSEEAKTDINSLVEAAKEYYNGARLDVDLFDKPETNRPSEKEPAEEDLEDVTGGSEEGGE